MVTTFEEQIYSFIKSKLADDENIESEVPFAMGKRRYYADIFLRSGCRALNFRSKTAIDLKQKLLPDTLYHLTQIYEANKPLWGIESFVVIYKDRNSFSGELLKVYNQFRDKNFYVLSEDELLQGSPIPVVEPRKIEPWKHKRARILLDAMADFDEGHNTFFFGAGLGADVNMPKWKELLEDLMKKAKRYSHSAIGYKDYGNIDKACNHSALILGRYIENGFVDMAEFKMQMHASLYKNNPQPTSKLYKAITKAIATGKVDQVITFNYDDLVETALTQNMIPVQSIYDRSHYSGSKFPVYHVHGMIPQTRPIDSTPVLSEKEYHTLYKESFYWSNVVQLQALSRTTCFFVGLSMNDPNLRRLLDISSNGIDVLSNGYVKPEPSHYAILERKPLNPKHPNPAKDTEHFAMQEKMMEDLGIRIIWYEHTKHSEIPNIIRRLW